LFYLTTLALIIIVVLLIVRMNHSKGIDTNRDNISNIVKFLNNKFGDEAPKLIRSESLIPRKDSTTAMRSDSDLTPYDAIQLERAFKSDED